MRLFTVDRGASPGARIDELAVKSAGVKIPSIQVGEEGRGRKLGVLAVDPALVIWADEAMTRWELRDPNGDFDIGFTQRGAPKLVPGKPGNESCVVVFRTQIGFRGSNTHTGDRRGWLCPACRALDQSPGEPEEGSPCPACGKPWGYGPSLEFDAFPGQCWVEGQIAEGGAGRAGSGRQQVATVPKGKVFRTGYGGRMYGAPTAHYHMFDGTKVLSATWDERCVTELF